MNKRCDRCEKREPLMELYMTIEGDRIVETETFNCGHVTRRVVKRLTGQFERRLAWLLYELDRQDRAAARAA